MFFLALRYNFPATENVVQYNSLKTEASFKCLSFRRPSFVVEGFVDYHQYLAVMEVEAINKVMNNGRHGRSSRGDAG